jgi:hypothetical protein
LRKSPALAGKFSVEDFKSHKITSTHPSGLLLTSDSSPFRPLSTQHIINARDKYPSPQLEAPEELQIRPQDHITFYNLHFILQAMTKTFNVVSATYDSILTWNFSLVYILSGMLSWEISQELKVLDLKKPLTLSIFRTKYY